MNNIIEIIEGLFFEIIPADRQRVLIKLSDVYSIAIPLEVAGDVRFDLVATFTTRDGWIGARSKVSFISMVDGILVSPDFDDGGAAMTSALLSRINQLRRANDNEIGALLPDPLVSCADWIRDLEGLEEFASSFLLVSLVEGWGVLPFVRHLDSIAKILEWSPKESDLGLSTSVAFDGVLRQSRSIGNKSKH